MTKFRPKRLKIRELLTSKYLVPLVIICLGLTGSVYIVRHASSGKRSNSETTVKDCLGTDLAADFDCWQSRLTTLTSDNSPEAAFADIKVAYAASPYVQSQCHQLVHRIGRSAAEKYPNVSEAYKHGDNFCWSGYYHGVMETIAKQLGRDEVVNKLNDICQQLRQEQLYSFFHYNCVHGLGHGVMGITNNELFESLEICDKLTNSWEAESCYGGAFMENIMSEDNPDHRTTYLRKDEPMYPCTAVVNKYKGQCYLMQSSYALKLSNYDFSKVFADCAAVDKEYVKICYQSVGRDASGTSTSDVAKTNASCLLGQNDEARSNCIVGAVKDFISYFHGITEATALCDSFIDPSLQSTCRTTATEYYKSF